MIQIIIGIGVVLALTIALAVLHKRRRAVWVSVAACMSAALAGGILCAVSEIEPIDPDSGTYLSSGDEKSSSSSSAASDEDAEGYLDVVRCLLDDNDVPGAQQILKEYGENIGYSSDYLRIVADMYEYTDLPERAEMLRDSLGETSEKPGKTEKKKSKREKSAEAAAKAYHAISALTAIENNGGYYGSEDRTELYQSIKDWADSGYAYSDLPALNKAQLASELYLHEYTQIAKRVMESPDGNSLIVASQLIRNGRISEGSMSEGFLNKSEKADAKKVLELLESELDKDTYSDEDREYLETQAETLDKTISGEIDMLSYIIDKMEKEAETDAVTAAKVCLELADIAYSKGDNAAASKYLEKALKMASQSTDAAFAEIVERINDIVFRSDDPEARKSLSGYVEEMERNRMPEDIPSIDTDALDGVSGYVPEDDYSEPEEENSGNIGSSLPFGRDREENREESEYYGQDDGYGTPPSPADTAPEETVNDRSFSENVTDTLNQMAGSVNILSIDTSKFPAMTAIVAADENLVSDAESFKEHMNVTDAGVKIDNYSVEKMEYQSVNVLLVCDDSGSMNGSPRDDLCNAVKTFVENSDDNVKIGMVPFADGIKEDFVSPLGSSKEKLKSGADSLCASGGTNIYGAVTYANALFTANSDELNIMILMSDGQDGMPNPQQFDELRSTCISRNISIYTVGLGGGADANLLTEYANHCNGTYFYVNSSESINEFYNFIYNLSKNRYRVTFDAVDTFQVDRMLEVDYDDSPSIRDQQTYSLFNDDLKEKLRDECSVSVGDVVINGLKEKMIYPTDYEQPVTMIGAGFEADAQMSVELHGADTYSCTVEYVDENTATVKIPGKVPVGLYDVYITYNDRRAVFNSGLIVSGGDTNVVRFGEYVFTASNVNRSGNTVVMSGVVQLNGWLGFTDPVKLTGDLENDYNVNMEFGNTYMYYTDTSIGGLSGYYASKGYISHLPKNGSLKLYNDPTVDGSSDEYPVEAMPVDMYSVLDLLKLEHDRAGLSIYPDRAEISFDSFTSALPFQGKILSVTGNDDIYHYTADADAKIIYSKDRIDCAIEVNFGNNKPKDEMKTLKLGNMNFYASPGSAQFKIDTKSGDVSLKMTANLATIADGVGFEIAMKDWKLDKIMFMADFDINVTVCYIPLTISDFKLGIQDLSKVNLSEDWTSLFSAELVGGCDLSMAKVSAYGKGLEKWVGDVSILALDDMEFGFRLKEPRIRAEATAKALGLVEVGHAKLQLGFGLDYENPLFVLQDEPNGFIGEVGAGFKIDEDNFLFDVTGSVNLALTDQAIGLWINGNFHTKIGWWIFVDERRAEGNVYLGWYRQHNGGFAFAVLAHGQSSGGDVSFEVVWGENDGAFASHKF